MELLLVLFLLYALIFGAFCAYLAGEKGRSGGSWFILGLIFGILALLVLIGLPSERRSSTVDVRLCPHCIQEVHELATTCPHCQRDLPEAEYCSYTSCGKIINPTDDRCEDDEGYPYCGDLHKQRVENSEVVDRRENTGMLIALSIVVVGLMVFILLVLGG